MKQFKEYIKPADGVTLHHYLMDSAIIILFVYTINLLTQ